MSEAMKDFLLLVLMLFLVAVESVLAVINPTPVGIGSLVFVLGLFLIVWRSMR